MIPVILAALVQANVAIGVATILVLALRPPIRRLCGARLAYALWALPALTAAATLLPGPSAVPSTMALVPVVALPPAIREASTAGLKVAAATVANVNWMLVVLGLWLAGVLVSLAVVAWRQRRFLSMLGEVHRAGGSDSRLFLAGNPSIGPAVVGAFRPRVVLPPDFQARFTADEQPLILAHEHAHLRSGDAQINALVVLIQCVNWFNPLVHLAARCLRLDQELACDAIVVSQHPSARKLYAVAMVKTQLAFTGLPLGCYWPSQGENPLKKRIAMLKQHQPGRVRRWAGAGLTGALCLGAGYTAWASQPPRASFPPLAQVTPAPPALAVVVPGALEAAAPDLERRATNASRGAVALVPKASGVGVLGVVDLATSAFLNAVTENDDTDADPGEMQDRDVNRYRPGDGTPLVRAARRGDLQAVTSLLDRGADPNLAAPGDGNPLIMAAGSGRLEIVTLLVDRGADVNGYVPGDETPLINAADKGYLDIVQFLVGRGADVNLAFDVKTYRGTTERRSPLRQALRGGYRAVAEYLQSAGAQQ